MLQRPPSMLGVDDWHSSILLSKEEQAGLVMILLLSDVVWKAGRVARVVVGNKARDVADPPPRMLLLESPEDEPRFTSIQLAIAKLLDCLQH